MPETPVLAQSPPSFNVGGKHLMIPLSSLYFDSTGKLKADRWPLYAANQAAVDALVARLRKQGALRPGKPRAAKPAFTATAVTPGGAGVLIEIEISNVVPDAANPPNSKATFKVTETDTYVGLSPAELKETIGEAANGGKRPGLVFVSNPEAPKLPANLAPTAMVAAAPGDPATLDVPEQGGPGKAFTLKTRAGGGDAILTSVEIKDVDVPGSKFMLVVKWSKNSAALPMTGLAAAFAPVAMIAPPAGGFLAPAAGKVVLSGGADAIALDAVKSSATVLAQ